MRQQPHGETIKDINRVTYSIQNQSSIYNKTVHNVWNIRISTMKIDV